MAISRGYDGYYLLPTIKLNFRSLLQTLSDSYLCRIRIFLLKDEVDKIYSEWKKFDLKIELEPQMLDFGYTFVAKDPDGHRLRVCATDTSKFE